MSQKAICRLFIDHVLVFNGTFSVHNVANINISRTEQNRNS